MNIKRYKLSSKAIIIPAIPAIKAIIVSRNQPATPGLEPEAKPEFEGIVTV